MGQQIALLLTDDDLTFLGSAIMGPGDTVAYRDEPISGAPVLPVRQTFHRTAEDPSLFFILAPNRNDTPIFIDRHSDEKSRVDILKSYVIEFWSPFCDAEIIRRGRIYVELEPFADGRKIKKDEWFRTWANKVFSRVRRHLRRDEVLQTYVGPDAEAKIKAGTLRVVP